jgi:hypothetical protein
VRKRARLPDCIDAERADQPAVADEHPRSPAELDDLLLGVVVAPLGEDPIERRALMEMA